MSSRSPNRSVQQWSSIIAECRAGTESDAEFCQRSGLNFHTFRKHKYANGKARRRAARQSSACNEVRFEQLPPRGLITVRGPDGVSVELPVSVDMNSVAQLAKALQHER